MAINIVEKGEAKVIFEPRGDDGLEGYGLGDTIKYAKCDNEKEAYYRVWKPSWEKNGEVDYYETCKKRSFNRYFKIVVKPVIKELITKKTKPLRELTNDLTREMDTYLKHKETGPHAFNTYLDGKYKDMWPIRFPGATRGYVRVDINEVITEIVLTRDDYNTDKIYKDNVRECFSKYIGMKLVIE